MSNTRTLSDRVLMYRETQTYVEFQVMNLLGPYYKDGSSKLEANVRKLVQDIARDAIRMVLAKPVAKPDMNPGVDWQHEFATAVEHAIVEQGLRDKMKGYASRLGSLMPKKIGHRANTNLIYIRIASVAGQVATMMVHGLDPDYLVEDKPKTVTTYVFAR